jgi:hypothetical protein
MPARPWRLGLHFTVVHPDVADPTGNPPDDFLLDEWLRCFQDRAAMGAWPSR